MKYHLGYLKEGWVEVQRQQRLWQLATTNNTEYSIQG